MPGPSAAASPSAAAGLPDSLAAVLARSLELADHGELLVASDFDGTLSELVADPWGARIIPTAQRALRCLATTPGVHVALISGRGVADLAARVRVGGVSYHGDHGAEWAAARRGFRHRALRIERERATPDEAAMASRLAREVPDRVAQPWLIVESKGSAVTFHFRAAPDLDAARLVVSEVVARLDPGGILVATAGRRAIELRPSGASHKGDTLLRLIQARRPAAVLMLGDDPADALAFDALRSAREGRAVDGLGIAVLGRPDVSHEVARRADATLPGPSEAARFLARLARTTARRGDPGALAPGARAGR